MLRYGEREKELKGGEPLTTNNRMELTAAIAALETLTRPCAVTLHTNSQYLRGGVTGWLAGWKRNGWRTSDKKPVKNEDLWRRLDDAASRHDIDWLWVRGHAGDPLNERADELGARRHVAVPEMTARDCRRFDRRAGAALLAADRQTSVQ